jgi:hypothetical protein
MPASVPLPGGVQPIQIDAATLEESTASTMRRDPHERGRVWILCHNDTPTDM